MHKRLDYIFEMPRELIIAHWLAVIAEAVVEEGIAEASCNLLANYNGKVEGISTCVREQHPESYATFLRDQLAIGL